MTEEELQDYNDSFLNDEHPLYYENNPDEQETRRERKRSYSPHDYIAPSPHDDSQTSKKEAVEGAIGCLTLLFIAFLLYLLF